MALCKSFVVCGVFQRGLFRCIPNDVSWTYYQQKSIHQSLGRLSRWPKSRNGNKGITAPKIAQAPFENIGLQIENNPTSISSLWKPFIFTLTFSGASLGCCAIWQYENTRLKALKRPNVWGKVQKHGGWRQMLNEQWSYLSQGQKLFVPICFANILVFLAWRIPRFQPSMVKYFCSNPGSSVVCLPMVLSTFTHFSFFHLAANMYVLHSFSSIAGHSLGMEQFLGLYLTGGVISSFMSSVFKVVTKQPGLSIGASGAIMAILGYVCCQYPDTRLSIILLPMYTFTAGTAIKFIVGLDSLGLILGWKMFDHAAHLGGVLSGTAWCHWGTTYIWMKREPLLRWWHDLRSRDQ